MIFIANTKGRHALYFIENFVLSLAVVISGNGVYNHKTAILSIF
ncbi:hypothetical protein [Moraxella lacunata]